MAESFTQQFQIRFDECAADGTARAGTVLRYVIETAFGHSAAEGYPLDWYERHGLFWLVRGVRLVLPTPIPYGQRLAVTTRVLGFRRIWARRENEIVDVSGEQVATVTMDWIFTDREGRPARVLTEMQDAFPGLLQSLEIARLELGEPSGTVWTADYTVPAHQVDPRGHMSSAAYIDLFEDGLAENNLEPQSRPALYEVEYLRAAVPGETLRRTLWNDHTGWAMLLSVPAGPLVRARRQSRATQ